MPFSGRPPAVEGHSGRISLLSLGAPHPFRLTRSSFLAELSRNWQYDNARIVVQWMTLVRAAVERTLKTFPPASPFLATALGSSAPSSSGLAGSVTVADGSLLLS